MSKAVLQRVVLLVLLSVGCGVAAAAVPLAEHYRYKVVAGKDEAQHHLHEEAAALWQQVQPHLTQLTRAEQASWWLARADLLQFEHQFSAALAALEQVLALGALQQNVYLMQARIALTQHDLEGAQAACQALLAHAQFDVVATCLLEVKGRAGELAQSYATLQQLHARNQNGPEAFTHWRKQILAEQAHLLGRYDEALTYLDYPAYDGQPVVIQRQILDVLLATKRAKDVIRLAGECPVVDAIPPDSLVVRIAHAQMLSNSQTCWQQVAAERIKLRVLRADALHTADLAYYFTYVHVDAAQARHWAELNSAVAREPFDQHLLLAALELSK